MEVRGGLLSIKVNGEIYDAKGNFSYNLGLDKHETMVGADRVHGTKAIPQVPFIEGEITDKKSLSLSTLLTMRGATVTLDLRNGKVVVLADATYCHEGTVETEEGKIPVRFEGLYADEMEA